MFGFDRVSGLGALLAIIAGVVLVSTSSQIFAWIYKTQLVLSPNSSSFPMWKDIPPLTAKIYLFNVLNPDEITMKGAIPEVEEIGPFVFMEHHKKTRLVWNENNTVTYHQMRTWEFVSELSDGSLEDEVIRVCVLCVFCVYFMCLPLFGNFIVTLEAINDLSHLPYILTFIFTSVKHRHIFWTFSFRFHLLPVKSIIHLNCNCNYNCS